MSVHAVSWVWCLLPGLSALLCSLWVIWQAQAWAPPLVRQLQGRCVLASSVTVVASSLMLLLEPSGMQTVVLGVAVLLAPWPTLWAQSQGLEAQKRLELSHWQRDGLTGLFTRKALMERAKDLPRSGGGGVILLDIDHFKAVNDRHLHAGGDRVLAHLARRLAAQVRLSDGLGRYGGEEFCLLLPGHTVQGTADLAERLLEDARKQRVRMVDGTEQGYTLSAGVAACESWPQTPTEWELLLNQADEALYAAKRQGRDRVSLFSPARVDSSEVSASNATTSGQLPLRSICGSPSACAQPGGL